ncbi:lipoprotein [Biostraticola tofi]|uniref:Uncharacterized protein DUF3828 n=1 Tax=Biostraticola tofi TaxID=466109 RepID=A0A4R3YY21_9GAMM|nr:lipoprotein [Biostraticola tofi]TCV98117.1 uncharacterized protein DUF3828 [Biostraticola tofi]
MNKKLFVLIPCALLLTACTTVEPAFKDIGSRSGPCVEGGPDEVAQRFYDLRIEQGVQTKPDAGQLTAYRPYLSAALWHALTVEHDAREKLARLPAADIFSSLSQGADTASVHSASTIPNTDAKNIPLRVNFARDMANGDKVKWQDEVLMVREGTCWVIDDVRYLGASSHASAGTLRQVLEIR